MTRKILITGTEGFVGKSLREWLSAQRGDVLDCPGMADLNLTSTPDVAAYLEASRPDIIIHSATSNTIGKGYASDVCEQNLRMFFNLVRHRPAHCVLYTLCSGSSYNRDNWVENMSEDYLGQHIPSDAQGFSKFAIASQARHLDNVVTLRLLGVFGKHEDYRYKFISNTVAKRLSGIPVTLVRDALYDYLDVTDFCRIVDQLIQRSVSKGEFNVTPDVSVKLSEIIQTVDAELDIPDGFNISQTGLGKPYTGDNQRLRQVLGDFHFTPLRQSVSELIAHYRQHPSLIDRAALIDDPLLQYAKQLNRT